MAVLPPQPVAIPIKISGPCNLFHRMTFSGAAALRDFATSRSSQARVLIRQRKCFPAGPGAECPPDLGINVVADIPDGAIDHQKIDALGVIAPEVIHVIDRTV